MKAVRGYSLRRRLLACVLASKPVAAPLKLLDCCPISDGAMALLVSADAGAGQAHLHQHLSAMASVLDCGAAAASRSTQVEAGLRLADIDHLAIYDSFTITLAMLLEEILHGLCSYGIACRAVPAMWCNNDPSRLRSLFVRFHAIASPSTTQANVWSWAARQAISGSARTVGSREGTKTGCQCNAALSCASLYALIWHPVVPRSSTMPCATTTTICPAVNATPPQFLPGAGCVTATCAGGSPFSLSST